MNTPIIIDLSALLLVVVDSEAEEALLYRQWLVALIRPHPVFLIANREQRYRAATLSMLAIYCDWTPERAFFKRGRAVHNARFFRQAVAAILSQLEPARTKAVIGISGVDYGRQILHKLGVPAFDPDTGPWQALPAVKPELPAPSQQLGLFDAG